MGKRRANGEKRGKSGNWGKVMKGGNTQWNRKWNKGEKGN